MAGMSFFIIRIPSIIEVQNFNFKSAETLPQLHTWSIVKDKTMNKPFWLLNVPSVSPPRSCVSRFQKQSILDIPDKYWRYTSLSFYVVDVGNSPNSHGNLD